MTLRMPPPNDISYAALQKSTTTKTTELIRVRSVGNEHPVQWRISRWTPWSILGFFVAGIFVAVGHHLFYSRLDGSLVRDSGDGSPYLTQTWIIRYGTALAFFTKAMLASAVVVAYKQHMWINLRSKANTLTTIDAMFAATHDVYAALSPSLLLRARIPALMALITWLLPITALITPSTLVVISSTLENVSMMHVPTLNLNDTSLYKFEGFGDGCSPLITRLTSAMSSNMAILPMQAVVVNTTYRHEFLGPSMKCETAKGRRLDKIDAIWKATADLQYEDLMYLSFSLDESAEGWLYNLTASVFVAQCVKGSAYDVCTTVVGPVIWARLRNESITCSVYVTRFNLEFHALGDIQAIRDMHFEWLRPVEGNSTTSTVFRATSQALVTILNGSIRGTELGSSDLSGKTPGKITFFTERTRIMSTAIIGLLSTRSSKRLYESMENIQQADRDLAGNRTLAEMIEELSRNQTLSLFSSDRLWLPKNATNATAVTQSTSHTMYDYRPRNLLITYGIAISFSAFCVLLGLRAIWINGICHDTSFSSIMSTTRNSFLDELTLGNSLGASPTPNVISKMKFVFGEMRQGDADAKPRAGFGLEEFTTPLKKGQEIY